MYKVFVNDKPLLTNQVAKETDFQLFLLESVDIEQLIIKMHNNKIQKANLYYPDEKAILKKSKEKIPVKIKLAADWFTTKKAKYYSFLETENGIYPKAEPKKVRKSAKPLCVKWKKKLELVNYPLPESYKKPIIF